jgi:hypothetical protein
MSYAAVIDPLQNLLIVVVGFAFGPAGANLPTRLGVVWWLVTIRVGICIDDLVLAIVFSCFADLVLVMLSSDPESRLWLCSAYHYHIGVPKYLSNLVGRAEGNPSYRNGGPWMMRHGRGQGYR